MKSFETIKVVSEKSDSGYVIINAEDFDPALHAAFVEGAAVPDEAEDNDLEYRLPRPLHKKMSKASLVTEATLFGIEVVPDEMTNQQIIDAIEAKEAELKEAADNAAENDE